MAKSLTNEQSAHLPHRNGRRAKVIIKWSGLTVRPFAAQEPIGHIIAQLIFHSKGEVQVPKVKLFQGDIAASLLHVSEVRLDILLGNDACSQHILMGRAQ